MSFLLGVLIFVVALLISVMLHEAGHFVTAKKFGMKVTEFFVGFGQTLWSFRRGETEYGIKALPFGGYVKIAGMTSMDQIDPADEPRSFREKPGWQRAIVLAAGSFMHFLLAFVLLGVLAVGIGLANSNTTTVGLVSNCVAANVKLLDQGSCKHSRGTSPAKLAGLRPGEKIVAIAGKPVHTWEQMGAAIRAQPAGKRMTITVERDGTRLTLIARPTTIPGRKGSYLGIGNAVIFQRTGPLGSFSYAGSTFGEIFVGSAAAVGKLPAAIPDLFAKDRAKTAAGQVSSVVGVADDTGQVVALGIGWQAKVSLVLLLVISLNIFIGAFNLLPLLPMDGGHLAVVIYERARAWLARLRGRPDPGLVDMQRLVPVSVGVFALLIGFAVLLIAADIFNPVHPFQ
jgi:membrane-associated protease RseP (regulator of RpoE activity)